jgi:hypothetical protein
MVSASQRLKAGIPQSVNAVLEGRVRLAFLFKTAFSFFRGSIEMMSEIYHLRFRVELSERIRQAAEALHVARSEVVRMSVARGLVGLADVKPEVKAEAKNGEVNQA